jgi:hypothetical protein
MSKYYGEHTKGCQCADCLPEIRVAEGYAIPGPEVSCMDAAEMLVDGFIKDARLWSDPEDRNELVRRVGTLLSMQRETLKREYDKTREELAEADTRANECLIQTQQAQRERDKLREELTAMTKDRDRWKAGLEGIE